MRILGVRDDNHHILTVVFLNSTYLVNKLLVISAVKKETIQL